MRSILLVFVLLVASCRGGSSPAEELEDRLLAPCCWRQPLRDHESPVATQLRGEIASRIAAGESTDDIEADLVRRYGDKLRAPPPRTWLIGLAVGLPALLGLALLLRFVRPSRRQERAATSGSDPEDSVAADRLDDELARVD